ncbi:5-hydroxytryptamine receptor 3A [Oryzias melastigma]|uniref:5-hydroxytryptamine receptor 3A n=1 Tax=Oryzias melastigma TaxID=30732 RepID=A0A834FN26_ORYME|nr:5-hydroxytryptamine receptor 3A [Oryzias melastigma]
MAVLWMLALLSFGVSGSRLSDCSYYGLLKYLNLTAPSPVLQVMRPVQNWNHTTDVSLDMVMYGILDVRFIGFHACHPSFHQHWTNEFLTWNPSDFCGIDKVTIPKSLVWNPDVDIDEDASDSGSIREDPLLILMSSGRMLTTKHQRLTSTCQLNLFLFPFDVQRCNITFSSSSYDTGSLKLGPARSSYVITTLSDVFMITQGAWNLKDVEVSQFDRSNGNISVSKLRYTVSLQRKPMLYVINLILPLFYLLILDLASFFISGSSGEKLGFKVTILLSISVLLLILNDILPSTEDTLPMIATYCVSVFTVVWLSVLEAILVGFLPQIDGFCCKEGQRSEDLQQEAVSHEEPGGVLENTEVKPGKVLPPDDLQEFLREILEEVRAAPQEAGRPEERSAQEGHFRRMAKMIDYVFGLVYFLVVVIFFLYFCIIWING